MPTAGAGIGGDREEWIEKLGRTLEGKPQGNRRKFRQKFKGERGIEVEEEWGGGREEK